MLSKWLNIQNGQNRSIFGSKSGWTFYLFHFSGNNCLYIFPKRDEYHFKEMPFEWFFSVVNLDISPELLSLFKLRGCSAKVQDHSQVLISVLRGVIIVKTNLEVWPTYYLYIMWCVWDIFSTANNSFIHIIMFNSTV